MLASRKSRRPLFSEGEWQEISTHLALPKRRSQVLREIVEGAQVNCIATKLNMARPTVRSHLSRLYSQFAVRNQTALVIEVFREFREMTED